MRRFGVAWLASALATGAVLVGVWLLANGRWGWLLLGAAVIALPVGVKWLLRKSRFAAYESCDCEAPAPRGGRIRDVPVGAESHYAGGMIFTAEINEWDIVEKELANTVREGAVAIGAPARMKRGSPATVTVIVSPDPAATDRLSKAIAAHETHLVRGSLVTPVMRVSCHGDGFEIAAQSVDDQIIAADATWTFRVTAIRQGLHSLNVTVSLRLRTADGWISTPSLRHEIDVYVTPAMVAGGFCRANWQWAIGVALGAAGTITAWQTLFDG